MGQFSVLLVLAALFTGSLVLFGAQRHTDDAEDATIEYAADFLAREAAQVGVERVIQNLVADPGAWSSDVAAMDAANGEAGVHRRGGYDSPYDVEIVGAHLGTPPTTGAPTTDPDWVEIISTGTAEGTDYVIRAIYERGYTNIGVPPTLRYAILADDDLELQGNASIHGGIHTNETLNSTGNSFDVQGTATFTNGWDGDNPDNYSGGTAQQGRIDVPPVSIPPTTFTIQKNQTGSGRNAAFTMVAADNPGTAVSNGWYGVTGKGVPTDPFILYVNGNLNIDQDIRLPGHVRIYVSGNLNIGSNARLTQSQPGVPIPSGNNPSYTDNGGTNHTGDDAIFAWRDDHAPTNTIGVFVGGATEFSGTPFINAQLHSEGDVIYRGGGNKYVLGGIVSRGQIVVQGNPKIYYNQAGGTIFDPGLNLMQPDGLVLVSHREWGERPSDP